MTRWRILTHGGAGSDASLSDQTQRAAEVAREALETGTDPLQAACDAVAYLEDDERFNAGTGSYLRSDGRTVEMDAACMDSDGRFGAVACIERVRHPIRVARDVTETDQRVLAGSGARRFARDRGFPDWDPTSEGDVQEGKDEEGPVDDTVGCVLGDGERFAAALSSGGTKGAPLGRVGDVPLPGAGLHAGPAGAVACTGDGEAISARFSALRAYERLEEGAEPQTVVDEAVAAFPEASSFGLIVVGQGEGAGASNRSMAASQLALAKDP